MKRFITNCLFAMMPVLFIGPILFDIFMLHVMLSLNESLINSGASGSEFLPLVMAAGIVSFISFAAPMIGVSFAIINGRLVEDEHLKTPAKVFMWIFVFTEIAFLCAFGLFGIRYLGVRMGVRVFLSAAAIVGTMFSTVVALSFKIKK